MPHSLSRGDKHSRLAQLIVILGFICPYWWRSWGMGTGTPAGDTNHDLSDSNRRPSSSSSWLCTLIAPPDKILSVSFGRSILTFCGTWHVHGGMGIHTYRTTIYTLKVGFICIWLADCQSDVCTTLSGSLAHFPTREFFELWPRRRKLGVMLF